MTIPPRAPCYGINNICDRGDESLGRPNTEARFFYVRLPREADGSVGAVLMVGTIPLHHLESSIVILPLFSHPTFSSDSLSLAKTYTPNLATVPPVQC